MRVTRHVYPPFVVRGNGGSHFTSDSHLRQINFQEKTINSPIFLFDDDFIDIKRNGVTRIPAQVELSLELLTANPGNVDVPAGWHFDVHRPAYRVFVNDIKPVPRCALQ